MLQDQSYIGIHEHRFSSIIRYADVHHAAARFAGASQLLAHARGDLKVDLRGLPVRIGCHCRITFITLFTNFGIERQ